MARSSFFNRLFWNPRELHSLFGPGAGSSLPPNIEFYLVFLLLFLVSSGLVECVNVSG